MFLIYIAFFVIEIYSQNTQVPSCQIFPSEFWDSQQCHPCKNQLCYCVDYNGCDRCIQGYYIDLTTQDCQLCPKGCKSCCERLSLTKLVCTQCFNEYHLISGICIYQPQCEELLPNGNCKKCLQYFFLNPMSFCDPCDDSCIRCVDENYCIQCRSNFYMPNNFTSQNGKQNCLLCKDPHCSDCQQSYGQICLNCHENYFLKDQVCLSCIDHCLTCNNEIMCNECDKNFFLTSEKQCKQCFEILQFCQQCDASAKLCILCQDGYYFDNVNQNCSKCSESAVKCLNFNINTECYHEYLLVQNIQSQELICFYNYQSCRQIYSNDLTCLSCAPDYVLTYNNSCLECNITNCTVCSTQFIDSNESLICDTCDQGYFRPPSNLDQCVACIDNCIYCLNITSCYQCNTQYRVNEQKICEKCKVNNCDVCNINLNLCDVCSPGYGLSDSSMTYCQNCSNGCMICSEQRKCQLCFDNYFLDNDVCKKYPVNCLQIDKKGLCSLCGIVDRTQYYYAYRGFCLSCSDYQTGYFYCPKSCKVDEIKSYKPNIDFIFLNFVVLYVISLFI